MDSAGINTRYFIGLMQYSIGRWVHLRIVKGTTFELFTEDLRSIRNFV
jgi:hypothetical protein